MSIFEHKDQADKPDSTYSITVWPIKGLQFSQEFKGCTDYDLPTARGEALTFVDSNNKDHIVAGCSWHIVED
jgi:hypothetical protein